MQKIVKLYHNGEEYFIDEWKSSGWEPGANTIAYYPLNLDANDYSGNNYHLTASGTVTYSEQGAYFDGSSYLYRGLTSMLPTGTDARTVAFWINHSSEDVDGGTPIFYGSSSVGNAFWLQFRNSTDLIFTGYGSGWDSGTTTLSANTWHCVIVTYGNSVLNVYLDNNTTPSISWNKVLNTNNNYINISKDPQYGSYIIGTMGQVVIENKARTAQEITDYYNQTKSLYGIN